MSYRNVRVGVVWACLSAATVWAVACGGDDAAGGPACQANQPNPGGCACPTGGQGVQYCLGDGSAYGQCVCGGAGFGGVGGASGVGGAGGVGGSAGTGGGAECSGGETCIRAAIGGFAFCGTPGSVIPATCQVPNEPCGTSGGTCQTLQGVNGCYKPCTPPQVCSPGQSNNCSCLSGGTGTQTCLQDGTGYGACMCTDQGGAGGTGGTAGTAGTGGTGGTGGAPAGCPSPLTCATTQFGTICAGASPLPGVIPELPPTCTTPADCQAMGLGSACIDTGGFGSFCIQQCTP